MQHPMTATFATRREAELAVERLVQEFGIDRTHIRVAPDGAENSAGEQPSGGDRKAAEPSVAARTDGALGGRIRIEVDLDDADAVQSVREAFQEFGGGAA